MFFPLRRLPSAPHFVLSITSPTFSPTLCFFHYVAGLPPTLKVLSITSPTFSPDFVISITSPTFSPTLRSFHGKSPVQPTLCSFHYVANRAPRLFFPLRRQPSTSPLPSFHYVANLQPHTLRRNGKNKVWGVANLGDVM